jgi:hypothetical protein
MLPIVLLILPADFFDDGPSLCLSVILLNETCFGCGITRAIQHLIHFEFSTAAEYNKLSFIVLPILVYVWASFAYQIFIKYKKLKN